jgi:hypothetical protein
MDLSGHAILVVDADPTPFTARLQDAIEQAGAQTVLVRTAEEASDRVKSRISAAAVNVNHRDVAEQLGVAYVLYTPSSPLDVIVAGLKRLVLGPASS